MIARELLKGDVYCDTNGVVQITVESDSVYDGYNPDNGKMQVRVDVRFRDGGRAPRWFDADDEVPYQHPLPERKVL